MNQEPDYYAILQVDPRAEKEVIQAVYRRLAAKYHPDVDPSPGASERMKQLNAAYEILSDPEKRKAYDLYRDGHRRQFRWLTPGAAGIALVIVTLAFRISPRLSLILGSLFLVLWLIWSRQTSNSS